VQVGFVRAVGAPAGPRARRGAAWGLAARLRARLRFRRPAGRGRPLQRQARRPAPRRRERPAAGARARCLSGCPHPARPPARRRREVTGPRRGWSLRFLADGRVVYPAGALGVVYDSRSRTQVWICAQRTNLCARAAAHPPPPAVTAPHRPRRCRRSSSQSTTPRSARSRCTPTSGWSQRAALRRPRGARPPGASSRAALAPRQVPDLPQRRPLPCPLFSKPLYIVKQSAPRAASCCETIRPAQAHGRQPPVVRDPGLGRCGASTAPRRAPAGADARAGGPSLPPGPAHKAT
jgi:hypothetical protein